MTTTNLSANAIAAKRFIIETLRQQIFVVRFFKADGSERRMRAQYGVHKYTKGTGHEQPEHLIKVYDHDAKDFRSINLEKIISMDCGEYHWEKSPDK